MNNKAHLLQELAELNLTNDEARLYIELLEGPNTHLRLARATGINRTKVYRLIEQLEQRSLVSRRTDDRGSFLVANDPGALEIELVAQEEKIKHHRHVLEHVIPSLRTFHREAESPFAIHTYEGVEGLKLMLWHELKTKDELLVFGNSSLEEIIDDHRWAEKLRARTVAKGYRIREIFNDPHKKPDWTDNDEYMGLYSARRVLEAELPVATPMVIYNDTVAVYQFDDHKRVGVEVINAAFARTIKSVFEHYWQSGKELEK